MYIYTCIIIYVYIVHINVFISSIPIYVNVHTYMHIHTHAPTHVYFFPIINKSSSTSHAISAIAPLYSKFLRELLIVMVSLQFLLFFSFFVELTPT